MQVPKTLDRFDAQLPDDQVCLEALSPPRWPGGLVGPEPDGSHRGRAVSSGRRGRGVLSSRFLRYPQEFDYRFVRRAEEDD